MGKKEMKIAVSATEVPKVLFDASPYKSLGYGGTEIRKIQDNALRQAGVYNMVGGLYDFQHFLGYGELSGLSQNGVIRAGVDLRADEMTRRWIGYNYTGESMNDDEAAAEIEAEITRFKIQRLFRDAAQICGFFGGCLAYIDVGDISNDDLKLPLGADGDTFKIGTLRGFKLIEPIYIAPGRYNCFNPLDRDYFVPQTWLINGREVHASRFLYFAEDKPPTLLLPAYNFFGIPLAQIVAEKVKQFEEGSAAASRLLQKFSCTVFATDMQELLTGRDAGNIKRRVQYFSQNRDNDGVMTIDKEAEAILDVSTPIGGVTDIVRQHMEIVAAAFSEPAVKLWGISPGGFNATGEADMKNHYDHVHALQERIFREPLEYVVKLLQLNSKGVVDDALSFEFCPLSDEDLDLKARVNKTTADTFATLIDRGVISGSEARTALANDPESGFAGIDVDAEIEPPDMALPLEGENEENVETSTPASGDRS
jgi:phage-related protein (TIGR01555 family)